MLSGKPRLADSHPDEYSRGRSDSPDESARDARPVVSSDYVTNPGANRTQKITKGLQATQWDVYRSNAGEVSP